MATRGWKGCAEGKKMCIKRTGLERMKIKRKREAGRGNKTKVVQCDFRKERKSNYCG